MTTARQLIEDAFDDLEIKSAEVDLTDAEMNTGIRRLNRLGTAFAAGGLNFGFSKISDKDDVLTIPDWAEDLFITYLAIRLAPGFGATISQALMLSADSLMTIAQRQLIKLPETQFPNTLPIGTGNYQGDRTNFFVDDSDDDLTNSGLSVLSDSESVTLSTE